MASPHTRPEMRDGPTPRAGSRDDARPVPSRRDFLRYLGVGGAGLLAMPLLSACNSEPIDPALRASIDLRSDSGAMNFASLIQQVQYQFYATSFAVYQGYVGATALEFTVIQRLWTHHSGVLQLFRRATPEPVSGNLQFDYSNVDFSNRASVLEYAIELEDIATAAMHGILRHAPDAETLTVLAKIASVEARHSATLRDLVDIGAGRASALTRTSFASDDVVSPTTGANELLTPRQAIDLLQPRFVSTVTFNEG